MIRKRHFGFGILRRSTSYFHIGVHVALLSFSWNDDAVVFWLDCLELKPGATVEWFFYPMTKGKNLKLFCHKNDHEEHGMVGSIDIIGPPPFTK